MGNMVTHLADLESYIARIRWSSSLSAWPYTNNSQNSDSVRNPNSPLNLRDDHYSKLCDLSRFSYSRASGTPPTDRLNCSRIGLSILFSLVNEINPYEEIINSSKNIVFRQQFNMNAITSFSHLNLYLDSSVRSIEVSSRLGGLDANSRRCDQVSPCLFGSSNLSYNQNPNASSKTSSQNKDTPCPIASPLHRSFFDLTLEEMEQLEEYTRISFHGPNRKVTHIFCDYIFECHPSDLSSFTETNGQVGESYQVANQWGSSIRNLRDDFLKNCYTCKKNLEGIDIYMYRGDGTFCSYECRYEEILTDRIREIEREMEKRSNEKSPRSSNDRIIFLLDDELLGPHIYG
ncbi:unnamed protein product [Ilex paraguariensis]|uniref:FLZ-type domain-containing protein n=1 Tax=Ilex paraguariensis TaxID=185542 RepID=A0ABC8TYP2_9AQUA